MDEVDYKQLYDNVRQEARLEIDYLRLTITEKLSVLIATIAIAAIITIFVACLLFVILWAALTHLQDVTGNVWGAAGIVLAVLTLIAVIVYGYRKQLIINPVARFVSRLLIEKPQQ